MIEGVAQSAISKTDVRVLGGKCQCLFKKVFGKFFPAERCGRRATLFPARLYPRRGRVFSRPAGPRPFGERTLHGREKTKTKTITGVGTDSWA